MSAEQVASHHLDWCEPRTCVHDLAFNDAEHVGPAEPINYHLVEGSLTIKCWGAPGYRLTPKEMADARINLAVEDTELEAEMELRLFPDEARNLAARLIAAADRIDTWKSSYEPAEEVW